jgi:hypothetical protein
MFHPTVIEYTYFLILRATFSKTDHILGHKVSLNNYQKLLASCQIRMEITRNQQQEKLQK